MRSGSDWTLWRRYCKRHNPAAYGRAPLSPAARPTRVAHLFSVGGEAGWRYYAFESREQLYAFLAGVPGAMEVQSRDSKTIS